MILKWVDFYKHLETISRYHILYSLNNIDHGHFDRKKPPDIWNSAVSLSEYVPEFLEITNVNSADSIPRKTLIKEDRLRIVNYRKMMSALKDISKSKVIEDTVSTVQDGILLFIQAFLMKSINYAYVFHQHLSWY